MTAKDITVTFGGLVAVDNVTVEVKSGEIVGLIGPNGAGKTTLFNAITGLLQPTSGSITVGENKTTKPTAHHMCKLGIGRTFQVCQPFSNQTVLQNVMVAAFLHNPKAVTAREKSLEIINRLGLGDKVNVLSSELTLIQLKRLELARALATEPKVLLLDEVMAGLNNTEGDEVMERIRNIRNSGVSIIVVEHVMRAIMSLSDRIYVLNQGKLIAQGSPKEISENPDVIKSYLGEKRHAGH